MTWWILGNVKLTYEYDMSHNECTLQSTHKLLPNHSKPESLFFVSTMGHKRSSIKRPFFLARLRIKNNCLASYLYVSSYLDAVPMKFHMKKIWSIFQERFHAVPFIMVLEFYGETSLFGFQAGTYDRNVLPTDTRVEPAS